MELESAAKKRLTEDVHKKNDLDNPSEMEELELKIKFEDVQFEEIDLEELEKSLEKMLKAVDAVNGELSIKRKKKKKDEISKIEEQSKINTKEFDEEE